MATIFEDALWVKVCSAVLSFVSLAISAYFKSFDLQTIAKSHKEAANGFLLVRDDLLVIISDIFRKKDLSAIDENYAKVRKTLNKLYTTAPQTTNNIYWKVRNVGGEAIRRNMVRGEIKMTNNSHQKEHTDFYGPHYVECYIVKNGICVARARIDVPIDNSL